MKALFRKADITIQRDALLKLAAALMLFGSSINAMAQSNEVELDSIIAIVNDDIVLASDFVRERANLIRQNRSGTPRDSELDKLAIR